MIRRAVTTSSTDCEEVSGGSRGVAMAVAQHPNLNSVIRACFFATLSFYVERTAFPVVYTSIANTMGLSQTLKGRIFSIFYVGYGLSMTPASWVAHRYGGYPTISFAFLGWSLLCFVTPVVTAHVPTLMLVRVALGAAQGFIIPSIHAILASTIVASEKSKAVSFVTSGMYLGSSLSLITTPSVLGGYGSGVCFFLLGALGLSWLSGWRAMRGRVADCEAHFHSLKKSGGEVETATASMHPAGSDLEEGTKPSSTHGARHAKAAKVPWSRIMSSSAVWAIIVNNFTFHYSLYVIMNWLPTYFEHVTHSPLQNLGMFKVLPYMMMFIFSNLGGMIGQAMVVQRGHGVRFTRVAINTCGFWASSAFVVLMPQAETMAGGLFCMTSALATLGLARGGFSVNHMDIAPEFASIIMGVSNTAGTVSGLIGVSLTGYLLDRSGGAQNREGWAYAFNLAAAQMMLGSFLFIAQSKGHPLFRTQGCD